MLSTSDILHIVQAQGPFALVGDSLVLGLGGAGQKRYVTAGQQYHTVLVTPQHLNHPVILSAQYHRLSAGSELQHAV